MHVFRKLPIHLLFFSGLAIACHPALCQSGRRIRTIIVDAGHGGTDSGAKGEYRGSLYSKEKDVTLAISKKLVAELREKMPDVKIIPTRTTDIYQPVKEKAQIANEYHGDLFVCIHADAVSLRTASRIIGHRRETYYTTHYVGKGKKRKRIRTAHTHIVPIREYYKLPTDRRGTSTWIFAAHKTDDKIKAMEQSDLLFSTDENDSTLDINEDSPEWKAKALLYTQNYFKKSYKLASLIQEMVDSAGRPDLGVHQRQKGIWVLQATQMPAVLVETGFMENYEDERYLNSQQGQQQIADMITKALIKYRDEVEGPHDSLSLKVTPAASPKPSLSQAVGPAKN
ncbi:MAG: N-acetylmuramoyl-L-alanine amidase [Bacteroidota bacterium]|nr:N-acetylmuramoyl-L-alanine amidase [Bacteroidota bacterium]